MAFENKGVTLSELRRGEGGVDGNNMYLFVDDEIPLNDAAVPVATEGQPPIEGRSQYHGHGGPPAPKPGKCHRKCLVVCSLFAVLVIIGMAIGLISILQEVRHCSSQICGIHGSCFHNKASYTCVCTPKYTGRHCNVSEADVPSFHGLHPSKLPFLVNDVTMSSEGNIVIVEYGTRVAIVDARGNIKLELTIPGARQLRGVARQGHTLFITDWVTDEIHVLLENNTYITAMQTELSNMCGIDVTDTTIWVTDVYSGVYKLTFDSDYNITDTCLIVSVNKDTLSFPRSISVWENQVVFLCFYSHNLHIYNTSSDVQLVPSVGRAGTGNNELKYPRDLVTDTNGRIYVADSANNRIMLLSSTGQFIKRIIAQEDGLQGSLQAIFLHYHHLYVVTRSPNLIYVLLM